ncbi:MAG: Methyl viologen resistance protein SmvA [Candidatus Omnitrophica bacterium ADurb.Bin314]|nr:MAG: Methyl viologen resistance protein SmvA [Candidatus Omnitrophica bacterium ADurb.Bin314]
MLAVGAAAMMPATLALIRVSFEVERERNFAIAVWGSLAVVGAALGPIVGGVLLEHFWWGSVFLINVPVVIAALIANKRVVPPVTNLKKPYPECPLPLVRDKAKSADVTNVMFNNFGFGGQNASLVFKHVKA